MPRKIRKKLQAALESRIGPIEETLKSELENIVRDAQDALTRHYISAVQSSDSSSNVSAELQRQAQLTQPFPTIAIGECSSAHSTTAFLEADVLSQYFIPPDATQESWPRMACSTDNTNINAALSDSAYFSLAENTQDSFLNSAWFDQMSREAAMGDIGEQEHAEHMHADNFEASSPNEFQSQQGYIGKGKERASHGTSDIAYGATHPDEYA